MRVKVELPKIQSIAYFYDNNGFFTHKRELIIDTIATNISIVNALKSNSSNFELVFEKHSSYTTVPLKEVSLKPYIKHRFNKTTNTWDTVEDYSDIKVYDKRDGKRVFLNIGDTLQKYHTLIAPPVESGYEFSNNTWVKGKQLLFKEAKELHMQYVSKIAMLNNNNYLAEYIENTGDIRATIEALVSKYTYSVKTMSVDNYNTVTIPTKLIEVYRLNE